MCVIEYGTFFTENGERNQRCVIYADVHFSIQLQLGFPNKILEIGGKWGNVQNEDVIFYSSKYNSKPQKITNKVDVTNLGQAQS